MMERTVTERLAGNDSPASLARRECVDEQPFRVVGRDGATLGHFPDLSAALDAFNCDEKAAAVSIGRYVVTPRVPRLSAVRGLKWMQQVNALARTNADRDSAAFRSGYRARLENCYRALACPESDQELINWLAGWDAADEAKKGGAA